MNPDLPRPIEPYREGEKEEIKAFREFQNRLLESDFQKGLEVYDGFLIDLNELFKDKYSEVSNYRAWHWSIGGTGHQGEPYFDLPNGEIMALVRKWQKIAEEKLKESTQNPAT
jgi:hypothetical protein